MEIYRWVRLSGVVTIISLRAFHESHVGMAAMQRGTIKKLVADKGFGFIASGERGKDLFFHVSAVKDVGFDALFEGQSVDYEMESGPKGDRACVVIPA